MATFSGMVFLALCIVFAAFIIVSVRVWQNNPNLVKKIFRLVIVLGIYMSISVSAVILGLRVDDRHRSSYRKGLKAVEQIWGGHIISSIPSFYYNEKTVKEYFDKHASELKKRVSTIEKKMGIAAHEVKIKISKNEREKGLLKFAGYTLNFTGSADFINTSNKAKEMNISIALPSGAGNITDLMALKNGKEYKDDANLSDGIDWQGKMAPGEKISFVWKYTARGSDRFRYAMGKNSRTELGLLNVTIETDFTNIDFPDNSMAPTSFSQDNQKSNIVWESQKLITGQDISLSFKIPGNWGKIVPRLFYFSPLSLFLFFGMIMISIISMQAKMHPMQWLLIGSGFLVFPLLSSYLFTYVHILLGMGIGLMVSTGLILWYVNMLPQGSQLIKTIALSCAGFQWLFSVAFLFPEHTGLMLTLIVILSLAWLMSRTAKTNWEEKW